TRDIAAFTMRKVQALRLVTTPGELTRSDVVICLISELIISLETLAARLIDDSDSNDGENFDELSIHTTVRVCRRVIEVRQKATGCSPGFLRINRPTVT
ncbi:MAG: hypothetical protein LC749_14150, partial [Actinobacteria bacterium]|nr:hypothetical protein [Actinomycetota bacterium]